MRNVKQLLFLVIVGGMLIMLASKVNAVMIYNATGDDGITPPNGLTISAGIAACTSPGYKSNASLTAGGFETFYQLKTDIFDKYVNRTYITTYNYSTSSAIDYVFYLTDNCRMGVDINKNLYINNPGGSGGGAGISIIGGNTTYLLQANFSAIYSAFAVFNITNGSRIEQISGTCIDTNVSNGMIGVEFDDGAQLDNITILQGEEWTSPTIYSPPNSTPVLIISNPLNNLQSHNATALINFSISTNSPNNNITYEVYIDKNNPATTRINRSENFTQGNFTFYLTLNNNTGDSINGTYFGLFNITDNASNNIIQSITFNLTNNISNYNTTNITMLPLPISIGNTVMGFCNITSHSAEKNNQSFTRRLWYVNNTQLTTNINSTTLNGTNATQNSNITFSCAVNNGYGETAWTQWVNSSTAIVGDATPPTITSFSINAISFITTDIINITANVTDNIAVNTVKTTIDNTNYSMTNLGDIWQYSANAVTFSLQQHNISYFIAQDTSLNTQTNTSTINFTVTSPPSGSGGTSSGGGGGGGGVQVIENQIVILGNLSIQLKPPILNRYFIYAPFKTRTQKFAFTFQTNKVLDKCISNVWKCDISSNNSFTISLDYSNDSTFINQVSGDVTLLDKSSLAKTITPMVTFINIGYAIPYQSNTKSTNYVVFMLNDYGIIQGIRLWFLIGVMMLIIAFTVLWVKYA